MFPCTFKFCPIVTLFDIPTPPVTIKAPVVFDDESIADVSVTFALAVTFD